MSEMDQAAGIVQGQESAAEEENDLQYKVFNDPIHGHMELHPLLVKIIDTPQFQRLRNIKQLGAVYFVYPGASHNRFEHSIGVAHIAGQLVKALQRRQPELNITGRDILCVQIAGLCHDLGHGPFSHLFDQIFLKKAGNTEWKHEKGSTDMFDYMVESNNLKPEMEKFGLKPKEDIEFIKEMINPPDDKSSDDKSSDEKQGRKWPYKGRTKDKAFLYDIVSNKRNGIDVDKFDYLARDAYHLGFQSNFDYHRFIKFARVCEVDGKKLICTRDKEVENTYDLFHTRLCLHRRACQHKVNKILSEMIAEAFLKAEETGEIKIKGSEGREYTISSAIHDMEAYTKLTDNVFEQILNSTSDELKDAREILEAIINRTFPKCIGEIRLQEPFKNDENFDSFVENNSEGWKNQLATAELTADNFVILGNTMDYGNKTEDPVKHMHFYSKFDPAKASKLSDNQRSRIRTACFSEHLIRVYCKKTDGDSLKTTKKRFEQLRKNIICKQRIEWIKENIKNQPPYKIAILNQNRNQLRIYSAERTDIHPQGRTYHLKEEEDECQQEPAQSDFNAGAHELTNVREEDENCDDEIQVYLRVNPTMDADERDVLSWCKEHDTKLPLLARLASRVLSSSSSSSVIEERRTGLSRETLDAVVALLLDAW